MIKINAMLQAKMIRMLLDGPATIHDVVEVTGLHTVTVSEYFRALVKAKAAHVSGWEKDSRGRDMIKVFSLGHGKQAPRQKVSRAEIARRYRARKQMAELLSLRSNHDTSGKTDLLGDQEHVPRPRDHRALADAEVC